MNEVGALSNEDLRSRAESAAKIALMTIIYGLGAALSLTLYQPRHGYAAFWPPSGIGLIMMARLKRHELPVAITALTAAGMVVNACFAVPLTLSGTYALGHVMEFVIGWLWLRKAFDRELDLATVKHVLAFTCISAVVVVFPAVASQLETSSVEGWSPSGFETLRCRWLSSFMGAMTFGPLGIEVMRSSTAGRWWPPEWKAPIEPFVLIGACALVSGLVFAPQGRDSRLPESIYILFPFLFLAAFRLGPPGAAASSCLVVILTIVLSSSDSWPVALLEHEISARIAWLQTYLATVVFTSLVVSAAICQLREQRQAMVHLHQAVQQSGEGIAIFDASSRIVLANPAWATMHGYDVREVVGAHVSAFHTPVQLETYAAPFCHRVKEEGIGRAELWHVTRDGREFPTASTASLFRDENGLMIGYLSTSRDLTEEKREEARRRAVEEGLRQTQRLDSLGRLAGSVAHDLNNLLTPILTGAQIAQEVLDEPESVRQLLYQIEQAGKRASELTRRLLALGREQVLRLETCDLNSLVRDFAPLLRISVGSGVQLVFNECELPLLVRVDKSQLEQVMMNLVVNAKDAMDGAGKITITTDVVPPGPESCCSAFGGDPADSPPLGRVLIRVSDTGTGIPAEHLPKIFDPFYTTKAPGLGTGLGLSTAYGIVKQHGGTISVSNLKEGGAAFDVLLPRVAESAPRESLGSNPVA